MRSVCVGILFLILTLPISAFSASYYVDSAGGNDSYAGTQSAPWRTVGKVNSASLVPGDSVFFKAGGTWSESLYPKSGSSSSNISYGVYGTGAMPILDSCIMHNINYVTVTGLEFISVNNIPVDLQGSSYNTIQNCAVYADVNNTGCWSALWVRDGSSYNKILNNTVQRRNLSSQGNALTVSTNTNYNVIQGNNLGVATHYALEVSGTYGSSTAAATYNIIKNNIINNNQGAQAEMIMNADHNIFDGNTMSGGLSTSMDANSACTLALAGSYNIIRNNIFKNNPTSAYGLAAVAFSSSGLNGNLISNRIYNNIFTNIASRPIYLDNYNSGSSVINDTVFKNNIIYANPTSSGVQFTATPYAGTYSLLNNLIYLSGASNVLSLSNSSQSVAKAETSYPSSISGNLQIDPQLDSSLQPTAGSTVIDAGTTLTTVTSASGSGTSLTVSDAGYFTDGRGMVPGDTIQVGNAIVQVASINYSTKTLTLASSISWSNGAAVSLPYSGSNPDIGAFENGSTPFAGYTIMASAGTNGSISPSGSVSVNSGASQTFTIIPASGYTISGITVDGVVQGAATSYTFSSVSANHTIAVSFAAVSPPLSGVVGSTVWQNTPLLQQSGAFTASFDLTPLAANMDGVTMVSAAPAQAFTDGAVIVRLNQSNSIDVMNASGYAADVNLPYVAGNTYRVRMLISIPNHVYDVYVTPPGGTEVHLAAAYSFRSTQATIASLANLAVYSGLGSHQVSNWTIAPVSNYPAPASYSLSASAGTGGSISPAGSLSVTSGATQGFSIVPSSGYKISDVQVDGVSVGTVSSYTFSNVSANHSISASFTPTVTSYSVTSSAASGGSISPLGTSTVAAGGSITFKITPNRKFSISNVVVDGVSQGAIRSYMFSNLSANHTISASFVRR